MWHQVCLAAFNSLTVFLKEANVPRNGSPVASLLVQRTVDLHILTPLKSHCGVCKNASILRAETPLLTDCDLQLIHNETELKYCGE